ncbi:hypothetical protein [Achromobacter insolitus]|uniref:hypothetical protein n=1 Tax=Achromobacter insolitus TaxID=217204 RepID=UPI0020A4382F|nr:hypothetical protein [Achromobacter insolitus]MCP1404282.1 hypothetical protein [Achromobacter insolitus]
MGDFFMVVIWALGGFVWGAVYGRMKNQRVEDDLRIKLAELSAQNRLMHRLQARMESKCLRRDRTQTHEGVTRPAESPRIRTWRLPCDQ